MARKKTEEKRCAIVRAAGPLFAARRYDRVLMEDVASAAGIGKGTLYRYFKDKEELYVATYFYWMDLWIAQLQRVVSAELSPAEKLGRLLQASIEFVAEQGDIYRLLFRGNPFRRKKRREKWEARRNKTREITLSVVREGLRKGDFRKVDERLFVEIVRRVIHAAGRHSDMPASDAAAQVTDILLNGIRNKG